MPNSSQPLFFYMLGVIYGQGLGVPEDIKKGVEYLQKAGSNEEAKKELLKYKKTLRRIPHLIREGAR